MKQRTILNTFFFTYSAILLASFFMVAIVFLILEIPKRNEQVFTSIKQNCTNITAAMDREFNQMQTCGLNIAYSTLVRDRFTGYMKREPNSAVKNEDAKILEDLLTALICPNRPVDQVTLYTPQGDIVASGLVNGTRIGFADTQPWYQSVVSSANSKAFIYNGPDEMLSKYFTSQYGKQFVTYALQNYDSFNTSKGYIEIKRSLEKIIPSAIQYNSVYGEQIFIFDGEGAVVYPMDTTPPEQLYNGMRSSGFSEEITFLDSGNKSYFVCAPSESSDFCTAMVIPSENLFSSVKSYILEISLISICSLFIALLLAFFAAKRLTIPIADMCREVASFDLRHPIQPSVLKTNIIELNALHTDFCKMREKLVDSVKQQLLLQDQEMQSRMLALQSQMNPHFLYNSLTTIQSMADAGMTEDITIMCQSMSNILRYISSDEEQMVPLSEEILYTKDYLKCMVSRYQGDLSYTIAIPEEMKDIKVPKLCVQPLVENAIKFSSCNRPPYCISITASCDRKHYEISVKDNGPGFSDDVLRTLQQKIAEIDQTGLLPSLKINGMGLLNVYIRLKLLHSGRVIFSIKNNKISGACITIGEQYE